MNYYDILKINKNATKKEIKTAYKNLVKKYHPDVYQGDKTFAEQKTKEINAAYDILSDDKLKAAYDLSLSGGYEFDENSVYDEPASSSKSETYEDFYSSSTNNYSDNDVYEKYKKVYDDFVNRNSSSTTYNYTNSRENYSDYYRASAYRNASHFSSEPQKENPIQKHINLASRKELLIIVIIIYLFLIFAILSDLSSLRNSNTPFSKELDTIIDEDNYYDDYYYDDYDDYYYSDDDDSNSTDSKTEYDPYYIIGGYRFTLDELKNFYNTYYSDSYYDFDTFMEIIEQIEDSEDI